MSATISDELTDRLIACVDEQRLVQTACDYVSVPSPTGSEQAMGEAVQAAFEDAGLQVAWQDVEEGRPNVLGRLEGTGGGQTLMFNGHMDTSYSGREPHLRGIPGFQPQAAVRDGRIYGLGISNMKGALACYLEAVRAVKDAGVQLAGDVLIACVCGEIEKSEWGEEYRGKEYRGYSVGSRHLPGHGGMADMCILGEPTEQKVVLGHYGTMWARISTHGPFVHTAFSAGLAEQNSLVRMRAVIDEVLAWAPEWEELTAYGNKKGVINLGAISGGHPWRVSRTPNRTDLFLDLRVPPTMHMQDARRELQAFVGRLRERHPDYGIEWEVYITSPGSQIAADHPLIGAIDAGHARVFGAPPERDTTRWSSDGSALMRYGIETVNYGTSSGLPGADGESLDIEGLVKIATVYALTIPRICEVSQ